MKYTVQIGEYNGFPNCSKREAMKIARDEAKKNPGQKVFVTWFRSSDRQVGYLNSDGNHDITGEAW